MDYKKAYMDLIKDYNEVLDKLKIEREMNKLRQDVLVYLESELERYKKQPVN